LAYYPFTNASTNDSSGSNNNATNNGATATTDRFGNANNAYSFNGVNNYMRVENNSTLNPTQQMSVSAWCMWDGSVTTDGFILSKGQSLSSESQYELTRSANGKFRPHIHIVGALRYYDGNTTVLPDVWYNVTMTYNDTSLSVYVNGALDGSISVSGAIDTYPYPMFIGSRANENTLPFSGKIDDIRIYNRALSVSEIDSLYHIGGWDNVKVSSVSPTQNALSVSPSTNITATFNAPMNTSLFNDTTTFIVSGSVSGRHRGSFEFTTASVPSTSLGMTNWNGNSFNSVIPNSGFSRDEESLLSNGKIPRRFAPRNDTKKSGNDTEVNGTVVTFNPTTDFKAGEIVNVTLTKNIRSASGDTLTNGFHWSFTIQNIVSTGTFATKADYETGSYPFAVYVSDIDGDGDGDLLTANAVAHTVSVLKNSGDGTYQTKVDYATGTSPLSVYASDIDGDGDEDILVANNIDNTVSVLKNNGDGTYQAKLDYTTGVNPNSVYASDIDGDGDEDILVAGGPNTVSVLKNNGDGTYQAKVDYATGSGPGSVFASDIDGDGDADIVVTNVYSNTVSVLKNNGNGTFASKVDYGTGGGPYSVYASDVDGDGDVDLLTANVNLNTVSVLKNNGDGTYQIRVDYSTGTQPISVYASDIDGDGDEDILTANEGSNTVSVLKNNGNGTFAAIVEYATGSYPISVHASDIDGDGDVDILATNRTSNTISILKNINLPPAPSILFSRTTIPFGLVFVDSTKQDSVIITNSGTADLVVSNITSDNIVFVADVSGFTLTPSESKTVHITFTPTAVTTYNGNIIFTHNGEGSPDTIIVSGEVTTTPFPIISVTPLNIDFGNVLLGTNKQDSIIVTNTGTANLIVSDIYSNNSVFTFDTTNFTLAPNISRAVHVTFTPTSINTQLGNIIVYNNSAVSQVGLNVTGTGTRPIFHLSRSSIPFLSVLLGASKQDSFIISNTGTADLIVSNITSDDSAFNVQSQNFTLAPTESKRIDVSFTPDSAQTYSGNIIVEHNAQGNPDTVKVSGTGTTVAAPLISFSTTSLSFGNVPLNGSVTDSVLVSNSGNVTLNVTSVNSSSGVFVVSPPSFFVPSSQSKSIRVTFTPTDTLSYNEKIILTHNAEGSPDTILLSGNGLNVQLPLISLSASSFAFGNVTVNVSKVDSLIVTNTGTATLNVTNVASNNSAFVISSTNFSLSPTESKTIRITFTPDSSQNYNGTITLTHNASGSPTSVSVSGTGTTQTFPLISVSATTLSFGTVLVGNDEEKNLKVYNSGTGALNVNNITSDNMLFTLSANSLTVSPNDSASITINFLPVDDGAFIGAITLTHNAGSPISVIVTGAGQTRIANGLQTTVGRFSSGIPAKNWALMSIPYKPDNSIRNVLESQLPGSGKTKVFALENGSYKDITSSGSSYHLTDGFWLKTVAKNSSFDLNFGSGDLIGGDSYTITIPNGWSFIGSPFYPQEASWMPVNTQAGTSGIRVYKYAHENKQWSGPIDPSIEKLQPFGGYAVWNGTGNSATFTFHRGTSPTPLPEFQNGDGWFSMLNVGNTTLRIGQHKRASDETDVYDYPKPLSSPDVVDDEAYLSGKLWSDIKSSQQMNSQQMNGLKEWKVFINPKNSRSIFVNKLEGLPADWKVVLRGIPNVGEVELTEGETIQIPKNISVSFVAEIIAGKSELVTNEIPKEFSLHQNFPNPFNPSTTISFNIVETQHTASLQIYDIIGREIATLFNGELQSGKYNFIWEGKNDNGETVGSGMYVARLQTKEFTKSIKMELLK
ncbi:MAG: choice-of-anchor D domain-containing protein, partial [Ignavibacteriales bacterium]|nr:choice-of-anchor D domain-containing protein [Ignavibacteriales bacterium]